MNLKDLSGRGGVKKQPDTMLYRDIVSMQGQQISRLETEKCPTLSWTIIIQS